VNHLQQQEHNAGKFHLICKDKKPTAVKGHLFKIEKSKEIENFNFCNKKYRFEIGRGSILNSKTSAIIRVGQKLPIYRP